MIQSLCFSSLLELPSFHVFMSSLIFGCFSIKEHWTYWQESATQFLQLLFTSQVSLYPVPAFLFVFLPFHVRLQGAFSHASMSITSLQTQHMVLCLSSLNPFMTTQLNFAPVNHLRLNTQFADHSFKLQTKGKSKIPHLKKTLHTTDHIAPENKRMWWTKPTLPGEMYMKLRQRSNFALCILTCVIPTICPIVIAGY